MIGFTGIISRPGHWERPCAGRAELTEVQLQADNPEFFSPKGYSDSDIPRTDFVYRGFLDMVPGSEPFDPARRYALLMESIGVRKMLPIRVGATYPNGETPFESIPEGT